MTSSHLPRVEQAAAQLQAEIDRFHAAQFAEEQREAEARQARRDDDATIAIEARRARARLALGERYVSVDREFLRDLLHMAVRPIHEEMRAAMAAGQQLTERGITARLDVFWRSAERAVRGGL
jgi:transposase